MAYDTLVLAQHDAVLTITVNRPEVLNAQSRIMREEFDAALAQAAEDDSIRVVIVAGAGQHFSAGHDIGSPQEREDRQHRPFAPGIVGEYKRNWDFNILRCGKVDKSLRMVSLASRGGAPWRPSSCGRAMATLSVRRSS